VDAVGQTIDTFKRSPRLASLDKCKAIILECGKRKADIYKVIDTLTAIYGASRLLPL
jgi:hypothetical protein